MAESENMENTNAEEIVEINKFQEGIQIWSATQEHLEGQALKELDFFVSESTNLKLEVEKNLDIPSTSTSHLNFENYYWGIVKKEKIICDEKNDSGSEYEPSEDGECSDSDYCPENETTKNKNKPEKLKKVKKVVKKKDSKEQVVEKVKDDALAKNYKDRLNKYYKKLEKEALLKSDLDSDQALDHKLRGGLKVPYELWNKLYSYQREGLKWLWDLHQNSTGGLLGDEMGLGKTVQIIVFLHCLQYSRIISRHCKFIGVGGSIIVCPATVIHQWVKHFHEWSPEFRVTVLHQSGTHQGNKAALIKDINLSKGILITTYMGILKYKGSLVEYNWQYLILDEGHKIRNPTAKVTVAVKKIRTPHRIMLTGSPMQNNLTELWSLFDFTNPGMLGELNTFQEHFVTPILQGGLANASPMQEATALSVATTLKNVISPHMLRRTKAEVKKHINLPHKSEQVLFCSLTKEQKDMYKNYLMGEQVNTILGRGLRDWRSQNFMRANMLMAITALRKICNHPDLYLYDEEPPQDHISAEEDKFGYYKRSGKMVVVSALLKIWKQQGHKVLLFSQGRGMIKVFEYFLSQQQYQYLKMDGSTNVSTRQKLIDTFNKDDKYFVFLLTTRVGGIGVNLTGANRVIIYDPDWNPATDTQARERSWRIGQQKSVTIYRLISAGTIEEKMYQRQVWKQLLSNKVLIDPSTNKFFKNSDLHDLFSLPPDEADPEKTNIFHDYRVKIQENVEAKKRAKKEKGNKKSNSTENNEDSNEEKSVFSEDRLQKMRELAKKIARNISNTNPVVEDKPNPKKTGYQKLLEEQREEKLKDKQKLKVLTPPELLEYNRKKAREKQDDNLNQIDGKVTDANFETALEYSSKTAELYSKILHSTKDIPSRKISRDSSGTSDTEPSCKKSLTDESVNVERNAENKIVIFQDCKISNSKNIGCENGTSVPTISSNHLEEKCDKKLNNPDSTTSNEHKYKVKTDEESHRKHKKSKKRKHKVDTSGEIDGNQVEGLVKREVKKIKSKSSEKESKANDSFILQHLFSKGVSSAVEHESVISGKSNKHSLKVREEAGRKAAKALEALKKRKSI